MSGYAARAADVGAAADAELARAWADSPRMRPAVERPGLHLLLDEDFTTGLPPELSLYDVDRPPASHAATAWWDPSRCGVREPGVLSWGAWRGGTPIPAAFRPAADTDGLGRVVSAGGGLWRPSARWPEATPEAWGRAPARAGKARGFLYGRIECRMRLEPDAPGAPGIGMVWWLYPADDRRGWPAGTELDIVETGVGDRQRVTATLHYADPVTGKHRQIQRPYVVDATRWHTYALDWAPGRFVGYVDDVEAWRIESPAVPSWHMVPGWQSEAFTAGDGWTGPAAAMHVGGVRVWEATP